MRIKIAFVLFISLLSIQINKAQDPHFSQIQYNPIYLNPANAGFAKKDNRIAGIYRDQWRTAPVPFSTTHASYDRKFKQWEKGWRLGGGVSFLYDRAGDGVLSTFNPNLTLAVGKYFNSGKQLINIGVTSGITLKSINYSKLSFDNQYIVGSGYSPSAGTGEVFANNNVSFPNFTVGLNFTTKIGQKSAMDIGGTVSNLHEPNQNFLYFSESKLPARYSAYAKAQIGMGKNDKWNLQPGVFYNFQNKANNILANAIAEVRFKENKKSKTFGLGFGAGYRVQDNDAAIAYISVLYDNLRIGASYDVNVSNFRKATNTVGAFEIALVYEWGESDDKKKKKKTDTIRIKELEILTDTIYLSKTDTINTIDNITNSINPELPCNPQIAEWNDELSKLLPVVAYFDNDRPNPKSVDITTTDNYKDLYDAYLNKKTYYVDNIGQLGANEIFNTVTKEFEKLEKVHGVLKEALDAGKTVKLQFLGFASPLANSQYNLNLSKRRIESVKNYFSTIDNGSLNKYINNGQLVFDFLPLGKSTAPQGISDRLNDIKNSVYSKDACMQRKVEIKYIIIK
jgi:type IX secretion system PorP/SprF family membrane protein